MKVILRQDVPDVGAAGQTVEVKTGFGRNYLIPRNLAIPATKASLRAIDEIRKQTEIREKKARREAEVVKDRIEKVSLTHEVLVGEDDRLYGSVTNADIAERLAAEGITVDKRAIQLDTPIKVLGIYTVPVKIAKDVTANLKLVVVKKSE
ncbi:MAG TPA: 50S ribosomal protein L9 [candidate division Zixibacteria bacterium]|nr:50S ribosomal protein L9 [candidate division Zixibacteria bacterium]MDD4916631.1 50S ribosomal protein L9 [candidate division Zixibacteria bacterium]MDM7974144.1 50S ribosomal protein L9 [candidate division Zixibacteria bacterium]HOD67575.1 50S ribosomal protein L9 [candidate division Zixibacteria bacterium]HOZ08020.1 50S ribosomal protein L9 [candidate division Zixibacteria bacterium]